MRRLRNIREERGQAVTEFAVVLPLLAVMLFGLIQGGITLNHYLTLTDAVRVGARAASVNADLGASGATAVATYTIWRRRLRAIGRRPFPRSGRCCRLCLRSDSS